MASHPSAGTREMLVGRAAEQQRLRSALDRLLEGSGSLVLVSGEAGIGKTTLVQDVASAAAEHGALVLTGHSYDLSTTPPYGPWLEIVRGRRADGLLGVGDHALGRGLHDRSGRRQDRPVAGCAKSPQ